MKPAIRVDNLSKQYRIGKRPSLGSRNLTESLTEGARGLWRGLTGQQSPMDDDNSFWALKDVSFEVQPGEVVGIIGRNGAGKSTLLKILSRIVEPTSGRAEIRGRMGSLLEVGTGFHPELTGRENIYLNGTILGMTRREIDRKFDEIVAFSEIEKFLDTPVKRYSSGMYVRLAFAVAAHLEPEILIVDEVLAVGDLAFQKKCLGKMQDVSLEGRTVLFVSHNMAPIRKLCRQVIVLKSGVIDFVGPTDKGIRHYFGDVSVREQVTDFVYSHKEPGLDLREVRVKATSLEYGQSLRVELTWESDSAKQAAIEVILKDQSFHPISFYGTGVSSGNEVLFEKGLNRIFLEYENLPLAEGRYYLDIAAAKTNVCFLAYAENALAFDIELSDPLGSGLKYQQGNGSVYLPCRMTTDLQIRSIILEV